MALSYIQAIEEAVKQIHNDEKIDYPYLKFRN